MPDTSTIIVAGGIFALLVILQVIVRSRHPIQRTIGGIFTGLGALLCVNAAGIFTGVTLPYSLLSLGISAAAGIPGVTLLLLLNLLFR